MINVLVPCGAEGLSLELAVLVLHVEHGPPDHQLQAQLEGGSDQPLVVGEGIDISLLRIWNTTLFNRFILNIIMIRFKNINNNNLQKVGLKMSLGGCLSNFSFKLNLR